jgi:hypothetical protein
MTFTDIVHYDYGTASVLEIGWTLIGLLGLYYAFRCLQECVRDIEALRLIADYVINGPREIIGKGNIRRYAICFWIFLVFVAVGGLAMDTPPAKVGQPTPYAIVLGLGFLSAEVLLMWDCRQTTRDRRRILAYIADYLLKIRDGLPGGRRVTDPPPQSPNVAP